MTIRPAVARAALAVIVLTAVITAPPANAERARTAETIELRKLFPGEIRRIAVPTSVPVLLPPTLPWGDVVPRLYFDGRTGKTRWSISIAAAPGCRNATACFVASFEGRRGAVLPRTPNLRLPGGQPAIYTPIRCGASCSPATLSFLHRGAIVTWRLKEPPPGGSRALGRLAAAAIAAGSR